MIMSMSKVILPSHTKFFKNAFKRVKSQQVSVLRRFLKSSRLNVTYFIFRSMKTVEMSRLIFFNTDKRLKKLNSMRFHAYFH